VQAYLAGKTNDDAEEGRYLEQELTLLRDRINQPSRSCRLGTKFSATR